MTTLSDDDRQFIEEAAAKQAYWSCCAKNVPRLLAIIDSLQKEIEWASEYIVEPDWFPNEGDRQQWRERRAALKNRGSKP